MDKQSCTERLKELNVYDLFYYRPELKVVPRILPTGESIQSVSAGISAGKKWFVVFGETHAYFIHTHPVNGTKTRKVPYRAVTAFETVRGILFGKIILTLGEESIRIENCPKRTIAQVEGTLDRYTGTSATAGSSGGTGASETTGGSGLAETSDVGGPSGTTGDGDSSGASGT